MQPEFKAPDFIKNNSADEIHRRMMNNLPPDMDDMPGGFPYDFTKPAAIEKSELIEYHLARALMTAFPMYAWDDWLDLHGQQVHLIRHEPKRSAGSIAISGIAGTEIPEGTVFCTAAGASEPGIEFVTDEAALIPDSGSVTVPVTAVRAGRDSNVGADTVTLMARPLKGITSVTNQEAITGGTERESNDDFYERIAAEYANSMTYLGNDSDYIRWAREAGAGDCIVVSAWDGPGTVKLVLVDSNGHPANEKLLTDVYEHIVSPKDRSRRLLPTACALLTCVPAKTVRIGFTLTGLLHDGTTSPEQIKEDFCQAVKPVYSSAKKESLLRYNDIRPLISAIAGVEDFDSFLVNGAMENIVLDHEEYPETGTLDFS